MKRKGKAAKFGVSPAAPVIWAAAAAAEPDVWLLCVAAALAAHEAAHLCAMLILRVPVKSVRVRAAGLEISRGAYLSYRKDIAVSLAGPLISLAAGAAALPAGGAVRFFGASSLALGVLNLLPVAGLDGGEALYSALCAALGPGRAWRITRGVSTAFCILIWIFSVWLFMFAGNFSLFLLSAVLFCSSAFGV